MVIIDKEIAPGLHLNAKYEDGKLKVALEEDALSGAKQLLNKLKVLIPGEIDDKIIDGIESVLPQA